ncbi:MAG: type II toxin-antitoxin system CcdA family antitoxin [Thermoplasmata archaeon]|nr:type II toxin-antitoxin system CcdA family antitoxin [Candidatus Sysuiplasma acidicola]MBX8638342.1 type II toxin-antitoxin system CcdA family antitoxin [Candidatus Sysuiplasma acidicola]MBX8646125.1 type II toxin-antitoxin system CcdA family antitoxin [Candidatus Sysuiplasma acidicola]
MTERITVRIDREKKAILKKYNINVSETVRNFLKSEIAEREKEELLTLLEKSKIILSRVPDREIVRAIRSTRGEI